jgi:hypothetical protein
LRGVPLAGGEPLVRRVDVGMPRTGHPMMGAGWLVRVPVCRPPCGVKGCGGMQKHFKGDHIAVVTLEVCCPATS